MIVNKKSTVSKEVSESICVPKKPSLLAVPIDNRIQIIKETIMEYNKLPLLANKTKSGIIKKTIQGN